MKKLYLFIHNHFIGFIRIWLLLLLPCALNEHFAAWMITANITLWMLLMCGEHNRWWEDVDDTVD